MLRSVFNVIQGGGARSLKAGPDRRIKYQCEYSKDGYEKKVYNACQFVFTFDETPKNPELFFYLIEEFQFVPKYQYRAGESSCTT